MYKITIKSFATYVFWYFILSIITIYYDVSNTIDYKYYYLLFSICNQWQHIPEYYVKRDSSLTTLKTVMRRPNIDLGDY